ncbi:MAG: N-acetyl-gamma-glutamyl-phosphate reductase [Ktedonobacterales bacterium]|jgi:N-acetyl-gamma-glutamyl-phosphate reductase|nr:MAG: N-acetyl-gamma-glutamyl-phosphate reductase [Ktedonobacterales bacterium]
MRTTRTIPAAVVNGAGYGGVELLRLLARHPVFDLVEVTARSDAGKPVASVFPHLPDLALTFTERVERAEVVFLALPDDAAVEIAPELVASGRRVLDLSAAFRLRDPALYPRWYGYQHPAAPLLSRAVYGLPELARDALRDDAVLVACPGCYPTAAILALAPALRSGLIAPDLIVDAKSGLSGAGRTLKLNTHYSEANEDTAAYGLQGHRHQPEIAQQLRHLQVDGDTAPLRLTFTPHLVPMTRGILATCYAPLRTGVTPRDVAAAYAAAYADEPFVRVASAPPHTKWTLGSNLCFVYPAIDEDAERLIVVSALDNLVKGAAGQAVQCANLLYGLPETLGLPLEGVYP